MNIFQQLDTVIKVILILVILGGTLGIILCGIYIWTTVKTIFQKSQLGHLASELGRQATENIATQKELRANNSELRSNVSTESDSEEICGR